MRKRQRQPTKANSTTGMTMKTDDTVDIFKLALFKSCIVIIIEVIIKYDEHGLSHLGWAKLSL